MKIVVFEPVQQGGKGVDNIRFGSDQEPDNSIKRFKGIKWSQS